ncbi:MAG: flagellar biosynthetic protein FliO [Gammaproteobacteria bacterium]|nr:flagellar biosynthetic protein FliO [Gammaproteobacteria bacterium]
MLQQTRLSLPAIAVAATSGLLGAASAFAAGTQTAAQPVPGGLPAGSLTGWTLRMVLMLGLVLALVGGLAWLAQRLRSGGHLKSGLIEVVSGISLGSREKVVLLRVGGEQVLVGVTPSGMRTLHVMSGTAADRPSFASHLEQQP